MSSTPTSSEHERTFLRTLRQALVPGVTEDRTRRDFQQIFASTDDRQLQQRIASRQDLDYQGLVASFAENGVSLNLKVHVAATLAEAAGIIATIARSTEPEFGTDKHLIQHVHPDLHGLQLWKQFSGEPITMHTTFPGDPQLRDKTMASYIGITAADWGIAESATLVQLTAPGRPRSTSLVPSIHIGLLRRGRMLASLTEVYSMLRREAELGSVTFISGPSKTADIEAHMVHGAHGPREMHVIIHADGEKLTG